MNNILWYYLIKMLKHFKHNIILSIMIYIIHDGDNNESKYKNVNACNNKKLHKSHIFKFNLTYMTYLNVI